MEKKFELGPLQKMWIEQLRQYPERQLKGYLGRKDEEAYRACCLGELHLCFHRLKKIPLPFNDRGIITDSVCDRSLGCSCQKYGIRDGVGELRVRAYVEHVGYSSLARMNDGGLSWPEIADYVEANPENVFTKSV